MILEAWEEEKLLRQKENLEDDIKMMDDINAKFLAELEKVKERLKKYERIK